ncbi:hypothetical protein EDD37DRAFT_469775 [Exophiala viscosa]|uniref:uncharacterized protein n=1 Tax=Exophiala viscosa TaxID=2486360 RepID=UPI00219B3C9E|nr:hypothetical protein EDD37DRAFT_469775 [Exophiala viscosa]
MWILESNGDFLQGKRMWLKPGQRYLFGRVRKDGVLFAIDHKTVSRKHFIIELENVSEADVGHIHARTKLKIVDQNSKGGTSVNGELIRNISKELTSIENSIRPGTCPHEIIIRWDPCVLTFNLLKKEINAGVLKTKQARVQTLDIKAISNFTSEHTTHVVANKRNTAKGLLALITGKHLVAESYIDALEYSATPQNLSQEENLSRLETDFDSAWPDEKDHLPPPGKEPTIRPVESYQPDASRFNIFEGYTVVFGDQTQYDNLMPVITSGHGKAILFKVSNNETTVNELIQFLQTAAGKKPQGEFRTLGDAKVILVRWTGKDDFQEWTNNLINQTVLKTDQRAIDQSEFLDAILANDAALLQQSVPFESTTDGKVAPPPSVANSLVATEPSESRSGGHAVSQRSNRAEQEPRAASQPSRAQCASQAASGPVVEAAPTQSAARNVSQASSKAETVPHPFSGPRFTQKSGFRNFDDEFDPDAIIDYEGDENEDDDESSPETQMKSQTHQSKIKDEPQSVTKKRRRSSISEDENAFADELDDLIPAAAAFKRQKLGEGQSTGQNGSIAAQTRKTQARKGKKEKDIDVREVVKAQREEKEKAALKEQEQLEALNEVEDKSPANLVTVVTMDIPHRERCKNINRPNGTHGPEWDPSWNGRKNFKGFRHKGEAPQRRGHANKVIVPLVQVQTQTHGLGEQYWPKDAEEKDRERERKRKDEARSQRTQSQTQRSSGRSRVRVLSDEEEDDPVGVEPRDDAAEQASPATSRLQREAAEILDHEVNLDTPRRTRANDKSQATSSRGSGGEATQRSQTQTAKTQSSSKRAATSGASTRETKRQKTLPVTVVRGTDDGDEDSDDMKFRFGARKGRAGARGKG